MIIAISLRNAAFAAAGASLLAALTPVPASVAEELASEASKAKAEARDGREILDAVDDLFRGTSSTGRATMTITTEHWKRSLTLEFWTMGQERSLVRILDPKKERGTATLKVDADLWNYLPKVNRVIKLPSSMMSASWMGSHITNDDLVKESRMADDYDFEITFEGERDGNEIIEIMCIPKEDAAVVWGKIVVVVHEASFIPIYVTYYDEDLVLMRTMRYTDIREIGERELPSTMEVFPEDEPGESTRITYDRIDFDSVTDDEIFSLRTLQE